MSHIYLTENGCVLGVNGGKLTIGMNGELIKTVPKEKVESISIYGKSSITADCTRQLLLAGVPVCYFSSAGRYFGRLAPIGRFDVDRVRRQLETFDNSEYSLSMAKSVTDAKIQNQSVLLRRYVREYTADIKKDLAMIKVYRKKVREAQDRASLMGYEGIAARIYFSALSKVVEPEFSFKGRSRRPPKDPFNALLGMAYTMLFYEIYAKVEAFGLYPHCSFLHSERPGHPALVSDLMEEWRPVVADAVVMSLIQGHEVDVHEFVSTYESENADETGVNIEEGEDLRQGGVYLSSDCMKKLIRKFEMKMESRIKYLAAASDGVSIRDALNAQIRQLSRSVYEKDPGVYKAVLIR